MTGSSPEPAAAGSFVVVEVAGRRYGLPVTRLRDVFHPREITPVPLAPPAVAGLLNLRGRVVTAVDLRARLSLPPAEAEAPRVAVGLERRGDAFALLADAVGDVIVLGPETYEPNPPHPDPQGLAAVRGVHRLPDGLLLVLDVDAAVDLAAERPGLEPTPPRPGRESPR